MSKGRKRAARRQARKSPGSQAALGYGKYGSPQELKRDRDDDFGRSQLPPSLRGLDPDDEVNVIITTGDVKPEGAGDLLGTIKQDSVFDDGTPVPAGARAWQNLRPAPGDRRVVARDLLEGGIALTGERLPWEIVQPGASGQITMGDPEGSGKGLRPGFGGLPAGLTRSTQDPRTGIPLAEQLMREKVSGNLLTGQKVPAGQGKGDASPGELDRWLMAAMEEVSPGLTERLAAGVGQEELNRLMPEIARAMTLARRREEELEASRQRALELIAGRDPGQLIRSAEAADTAAVRTGWTADEVLDMHAWLARHYSSGSGPLSDYLAHLIRNAQDQFEDPDRVTLMFWPLKRNLAPAGPAEGGMLAGIIARGLREARTYQVTVPMMAEMREAASQVPSLRFLDGAELPAHAGFTWFDRPWAVREASGYYMPFRAVSWEKITVRAEDRDGRIIPVDGIRLILWTLIGDDIAFGRWDDIRRADRAASLVGQLTPQHIAVLPFGRRFEVNDGFEEQGDSMLAIIHVLWWYLGMELSATRTVSPASPVTARRAQRSLTHGQVHIVTLRRITYISEQPAGSRHVDRTCRWWVADFCRHIDHYEDRDDDGRLRRHEAVPSGLAGDDVKHDVCAVCLAAGQTVRITPVRGHIRGPSWLPLKQPAEGRTLHRLSR